jgi:hypothetical protein
MKTVIFLLSILLVIISSNNSIGQIGKESVLFHQIFSPEKMETILLNLPKSICKIVWTKSKRILVEQKIITNADNLSIINALIKQGRYKLSMEESNHFEFVTLTPPNYKNIIIVNGKRLIADSQYIIHLPYNTKYKYIGEDPLENSFVNTN